jgi:hypothetical protein
MHKTQLLYGRKNHHVPSRRNFVLRLGFRTWQLIRQIRTSAVTGSHTVMAAFFFGIEISQTMLAPFRKLVPRSDRHAASSSSRCDFLAELCTRHRQSHHTKHLAMQTTKQMENAGVFISELALFASLLLGKRRLRSLSASHSHTHTYAPNLFQY